MARRGVTITVDVTAPDADVNINIERDTLSGWPDRETLTLPIDEARKLRDALDEALTQ